jgi:hypothetical protein
LGVSVDGVDMDIRPKFDPVYVDTFGGPVGVPFDEQQMLSDAMIHAQLVWYDEPVLAAIRPTTAASEGVMPSAGVLMGVNSFYYRLLIKSPIEGLVYNFPSVRLDRLPTKLGTRRTIWNISWYAIPFTGSVGTSAGAVLYNHVGT